MKKNLQKTFLAFFSLTLVFISQGATASLPAQDQFMKENLNRINHAKNVAAFIDSSPLITKDLRKAIKTWAKIKGTSKIPKVTSQGSDFIFELNNKKAKFTLSDFENRKVSINDKPFEIDPTVPASQNLDNILEAMDPKHSVSVSLFSAAEASAAAQDGTGRAALHPKGQQVPPVDIGGAAVMGVIAYTFMHPQTDPGGTSLPGATDQ